MRSSIFLGTFTAVALISSAVAQDPNRPAQPGNQPSASSDRSSAAPATPRRVSGQWRSSKLIGVEVYNEQNEKLGEIDELLVDQSGKITGVIIGVGGFLGMGQRDIMVTMDKLKFVNEPVRTIATRSDNTTRPGPTTGAGDRLAGTANAPARPTDHWAPDHAVMAGATKDSLRNMQEFKYD